jgi:acyl transferase domain-containing protein
MVCADLGENDSVSNAIETITFQTNGDLDRSFKKFLLQLWLHGVHIEWRKIFPEDQFSKVSLPGYAFDRKSFWLSSQKFKKTEPIPMNQSLTQQPNDSATYHPECAPGEENKSNECIIERRCMTHSTVNEQKTDDRSISQMDKVLNRTEQYLLKLIGRLVETPVEEIDPKAHLSEYGVDSIMIHHFNSEIAKHFDSISKTLLVEHQSIQAVAKYLARHHKGQLIDLFGIGKECDGGSEQPPDTGIELPDKHPEQTDCQPDVNSADIKYLEAFDPGLSHEIEDIAIIGLSGRYPQANTIDDFWDVLKTARNCIENIPIDRWSKGKNTTGSAQSMLDGNTDCQWGGFLDNVGQFDPLFFQISPKEAELMDPQERLFLESVWNTLEDSGYTGTGLSRSDCAKVGVFVGVTNNSYQLLGPVAGDDGRTEMPVSGSWSIANRVSYIFNFKGPSVPVDTGCASSLTAIHLACESIKRKECALAVAGGVHLYFHPSRYVLLGQLNMLSASGKCHSFGKDADGFVPGEGVGAVLLKPLAKAIQDHDNIYAIIKSTSVSHNGRSNGYMMPNATAQAELIVSALENARIKPQTISYIETQSVGSSLGDPAEIAGLTKAFNAYTQKRQFCAVGSVKTNIGHPEAAAGIAGLTKVLLQMKHKTLVPSINSEALNPDIDFEHSPFYVQHRLTPWQPVNSFESADHNPGVLRAGISAFGAGGSNSHIIVEAYDDSTTKTGSARPAPSRQLFVLSAKTEQRLKRYAQRLSAFLKKFGSEPHRHLTMANIAYTLQVGREPMDTRIAVIAESQRDLCRQLDCFVEKGYAEAAADTFFDNIDSTSASHLIQDFAEGHFGKDFIELVAAHKDLRKLALLWVAGIDIAWERIHKERHVRRVSLPTYPFERQRYWISGTSESGDTHEAKRQHTVIIKTYSEEKSELQNAAPYPMRQILVQWISELLKIPENVLEEDRNLREYGFNSLAGMRLIHRIAERFDVKIPPSELFEHQSIAALSGFLSTMTDILDRLDSRTVDSASEAIADPEIGKNIIGDIDVDRLTDSEVEELIKQLIQSLPGHSRVKSSRSDNTDLPPEQISA